MDWVGPSLVDRTRFKSARECNLVAAPEDDIDLVIGAGPNSDRADRLEVREHQPGFIDEDMTGFERRRDRLT